MSEILMMVGLIIIIAGAFMAGHDKSGEFAMITAVIGLLLVLLGVAILPPGTSTHRGHPRQIETRNQTLVSFLFSKN